MPPFKVFARWRPLACSEAETEIERESAQHDDSRISISLLSQSNKVRSWKSGPAFARIFNADDNNKAVFDAVVAPSLPQVLNGETSNFFAYGHSGSGKSHTIVGYDYDNTDELGLCLSAARHLSEELDCLNAAAQSSKDEEGVSDYDRLGLGIRMIELRKNVAFDLLNGRRECHVREGYDGRTHIRGETEVLEGGKVRVRPTTQIPAWDFDNLRRELQVGLKLRATGSSTIHDQSSRTHAVLELEIVSQRLLDARDAVIERQSELVPVAKRATDIYLEEYAEAYIKSPEGEYVENPDRPLNQPRIDAAEAKKAEFESFVKKAEVDEAEVFTSHRHASSLGGKLVFVDLAGSEYYTEKATSSALGPKPTPQERQEGRQINTDLLSLKEVIRANALGHARIPFRSSPLTMVMREHFLGSEHSHSAVILTVSPSSEQFAATMNTLKYGALIGVAAGEK